MQQSEAWFILSFMNNAAKTAAKNIARLVTVESKRGGPGLWTIVSPTGREATIPEGASARMSRALIETIEYSDCRHEDGDGEPVFIAINVDVMREIGKLAGVI